MNHKKFKQWIATIGNEQGMRDAFLMMSKRLQKLEGPKRESNAEVLRELIDEAYTKYEQQMQANIALRNEFHDEIKILMQANNELQRHRDKLMVEKQEAQNGVLLREQTWQKHSAEQDDLIADTHNKLLACEGTVDNQVGMIDDLNKQIAELQKALTAAEITGIQATKDMEQRNELYKNLDKRYLEAVAERDAAKSAIIRLHNNCSIAWGRNSAHMNGIDVKECVLKFDVPVSFYESMEDTTDVQSLLAEIWEVPEDKSNDI